MLIDCLINYDPEQNVEIMTYDATYENDGSIIDSDDFRNHPITEIHDKFTGNKNEKFVSIECPYNDPK